MGRGLFITLEGPDGSGKSTQVAYLKTYFQQRGLDAFFTREPGGTEIGEKLREIILDRANREMSDMTEALLYAASRAQHVHQKIRPALEAGRIVVCDRFLDSSIAYQGYGRQLGDVVRTVNELAIEGCMPDLTFLLELAPAIGKSRIAAGSRDRLEQEKLEFHERVYAGYRALAAQAPERFVRIDAGREKTVIRDELYACLDRVLTDRGWICR